MDVDNILYRLLPDSMYVTNAKTIIILYTE